MEPSTRNDDDLSSTLVRRGTDAATFRDMVNFAEMLEHRPLDKLLAELPALAHLSEAKFNLATVVLRNRFRKVDDVDREQLRILANEVASSAIDPLIQQRIRELFKYS